jgi:hypothetical protein
MRIALILPLLALSACGQNAPHYDSNGQLVCDGSDIPIYSNRFVPQAGASGVATPADALNGKTQSDANAQIPSAGSDDVSAMTVSCGQADCAAGQVAVEIAPDPSAQGGDGIGGAPFSEGKPATGGGTTDTPGSPGGNGAMDPPAKIICTAPPPACAKGLSPQFTGKQTWECTDCSLVVTYGGQYGNVRRCASAPTIVCPDGQVPTWVYEDEQWECKPTCDNGQYDQHTIGGQMVCVPC